MKKNVEPRPKRSVPRRILRILFRVLFAICMLICALVVAIFIFTQTDFGRERIRRIAEAQLGNLVNGIVTIGRIEGSPLSTMKLLDVEYRALGEDWWTPGPKVITADALTVEWDPLALIGKRFHAYSVVLDHPVVVGAVQEGQLNLAQILRNAGEQATEPAPPAQPNMWAVDIDQVSINSGVAVFPVGDGQTASFAPINVTAGVKLTGDVLTVSLEELATGYLERGLPLDLHGKVVKAAALLSVTDLVVRAGASELRMPLALYDTTRGTANGYVMLSVAAADLSRVTPAAVIAGDLELEGTAIRGNNESPIVARLHAAAGKNNLMALVTFDPATMHLAGELHGRDLHPPAGPPSKLDLDVVADITGFSPDTAHGEVTVDASGEVRGERIDKAHLHAKIDKGVIVAQLKLAARGAKADIDADLRLGKGLVIQRAHVVAKVPDARVLRDLAPGLAGAADVDLVLSGTPRDLSVRGSVRARDVKMGTARAASVALDLDMHGLPGDPGGTAKLDVKGAAVGKDTLGAIHADIGTKGGLHAFDVHVQVGAAGSTYHGNLDGQVDLRPRETQVTLQTLVVTARRVTWKNAAPSTIIYKHEGAISVDKLALVSNVGKISVDGSMGLPHGKQLGAGKIAVAVTNLDLARLRTAFLPDREDLDGLVGHVSFNATLDSKKRDVALDAKLVVSDLVARAGDPALNLTLDAHVGHGHLTAKGAVHEGQTRSVGSIDLDVAVPANLIDVAAWRRLDPMEAVRSAQIELHDIDLRTAARLSRRPIHLSGDANVAIAVKPGTRELTIDLHGRDISYARLTNASFGFHGSWVKDAVKLDGTIGLNGKDALSFTASAPLTLHAVVAGEDLRRVPVKAHLESHAFPLEALKTALQLDQPFSGTITLDADVTGTAEAPAAKAKISLDKAVLAGVGFDTFTIDATGNKAKADVKLAARQPKGGAIDADAHVDLQDATRSGAHVQAKSFDLAFLSVISTGRGNILQSTAGLLDADVTLANAAGGETAKGTIKIAQGKFYIPSVGPAENIELSASVDGEHVIIDSLSAKTGNGHIDGKGDITLVGLKPDKFLITADTKELPVLAGVTVIKVSTNAELDGQTQKNGSLLVKTTLRHLTIHVPPERRGGAALQSVHGDADVVFVDSRDGMPKSTPQSQPLHAPGKLADISVAGAPPRNGPMREDSVTIHSGPSSAPASGPASGPASEPASEPASLPSRQGIVRIELDTPDQIHVTGPEADIYLRQSLTVSLRPDGAVLSGGIEADHGYIQLFGARWEISNATISFAPRLPPDPRLNIEITREFTATTVYVSVSGTLSHPKLDMRADPGSYDQATILSWVLGGSPDDSTGPSPALGGQAVGFASNLILGQVQDQIKLLLPVDILNVTLGEGADAQTTRVQVGKWVTDRLLVSYKARLNSPDATKNENEVDIEWRFARRWFLDAFYGDRGAGGIDAIWSKKY